MRKTVTYIKIIIPVAVIVGLLVFKQYFFGELSSSIATGEGSSDSEKIYSEYVLPEPDTGLKGSLLEFGATNCVSCRKMEKVLEEIRISFPRELQIRFINTTTKEGLAKGMEFGLVAIPMQILLNRDGKVVFRHSGYISTPELSRKISQHLNIKEPQ